MIFMIIGRAVAVLALVLGVLVAVLAGIDYSSSLHLTVGTEVIMADGKVEHMTEEWIRGIVAMNSQMTELGIGMALFGIVLGVLTEMRPRAQK